jgi:hypothetical protein
MKNKNILILFSLFQIFLLMNFAFAQSYNISEIDNVIRSSVIDVKKIKEIVEVSANLLIGFLSIKQIGFVSAGCCRDYCTSTDTSDGCEDYNDAEIDCSSFSECDLGCCINTEDGGCSKNTLKKDCVSPGEWKTDFHCNYNECNKGCCTLGNEAPFLTEKECDVLSLLEGFSKDWQDLGAEECPLLVNNPTAMGACVTNENTCTVVDRNNCLEENEFYEEFLCSHPDILALGVDCQRQTSISCSNIGNEDGIYWFDSCGNKENIYSSDKTRSYNNGLIAENNDNICVLDSSGGYSDNTNNCGNCNRFANTLCSSTSSGDGVVDGDFVCEELGCSYDVNFDETIDEGEGYVNGESWCEYDGYIGDGKDTVGSEHWRLSCINGEISYNQCGEKRNRICTQWNITDSNRNSFSRAACEVNTAYLCKDYNSEENYEKKCNENPHCKLTNIDVAKYFRFSACVPKYPEGFELQDREGTEEDTCGIASVGCQAIYRRNVQGTKIAGRTIGYKVEWECIDNCDCETEELAEEMNDFCISLGDCGSYINYIGNGSDGGSSIRGKNGADTPNKYSWTNYIDFAERVERQYASPSKVVNDSDSATSEDSYEPGEISPDLINILDVLGTIGTISLFATITDTTPAWLGHWGGALSGAVIGATIAGKLAESQGISGDVAEAMIISGGVSGALIGYAIVAGETGVGFWIGIALLIAVVVTAYYKIGKVEMREVKFICRPWQAPFGGDDCEKCDDDLNKPCSQYKCESLGKACEFINGDTDFPGCINTNPNDIEPPILSPLKIDEGFEFFNEKYLGIEIKNKTNNDGCIKENTHFSFALKSEEHAECKWDWVRTRLDSDLETTNLFQLMEDNYPVGGNLFTLNHTFDVIIPNINSEFVYDKTGNLAEKKGSVSVYLRCADYQGNFNIQEHDIKMCIKSGPDLTAAKVDYTIPEKDTIVSFNETEKFVEIWLNEPAECKYSSESKGYEFMENFMDCRINEWDDVLGKWPCSTTFTNLKNSIDNNFYIRCKDKPWLDDEDFIAEHTSEELALYGERNVNTEDYDYTIKGSKGILEIDSVGPSGIIRVGSGSTVFALNLGAKTSGGAVGDGVSDCYYNYSWKDLDQYANSNFYLFYPTTGSNNHKKENLLLKEGSYNIPIKCVDLAGNDAYSNIIFDLTIDSTVPKIVSIYRSSAGGYLEIKTDEEARCYYNTTATRCDVTNFGDSSSNMESGIDAKIIHTVNWITDESYHIECEDILGNRGICTTITPSKY